MKFRRQSKERVLEIFKLSLNQSPFAEKPNASLVARQYGVNEKTVRDIWARRTWKHETLPLANKEPKNRAKIGRPLECQDSASRQQSESAAENNPQSKIDRASPGLSANSIAADDACADARGNITVTPVAECCAYDSAHGYREVAFDPQLQETKRRRLQPELTGQPLSSLLLPSARLVSIPTPQSRPLTSDQLGRLLLPQVPFCPSVCAMLPPLNLPSTPAHSLCNVQAAAHPPPSQATLCPTSAGGASPLLSGPAAGWLSSAWAGVPPTIPAGPYEAGANAPPTGLLLAAALRRLDCAAASSSVMVSATMPPPFSNTPASFRQLAAAQARPPRVTGLWL